MVMNWHDVALVLAGLIGSAVALGHGYLIQRNMVRPIGKLVADQRMAASIKRLVPGLLHFSTISWFLGGLALITAAIGFGHDARLATGLFVGASYLYGAIGNLWATRGRHVGWMLMAAALVLIAFGVNKSGG
jgi:hypothetical protein